MTQKTGKVTRAELRGDIVIRDLIKECQEEGYEDAEEKIIKIVRVGLAKGTLIECDKCNIIYGKDNKLKCPHDQLQT